MAEDIQFTHVNIKPIVRGKKYIAEFNIINGIVPNIQTTIGGDTADICLKKTEAFVMRKLSEDQYTIHK